MTTGRVAINMDLDEAREWLKRVDEAMDPDNGSNDDEHDLLFEIADTIRKALPAVEPEPAYAMVLVVRAETADDAHLSVVRSFFRGGDELQMVGAPWRVVAIGSDDEDPVYDTDSCIAQRGARV